MINTLIDVSINTMIGNLPGIINYNNEAVENEFSGLFNYIESGAPVLKVYVSSNTVNAHTGFFRNINISGKVLDASFADKYYRLDSSVQSLDDRVTALEQQENTYSQSARVYEAESPHISGNASYDMTSFFMAPSSVEGVSIETIVFEKIYRTQDGLVIPLQVGTMTLGDEICLTVYHEHINSNGIVDRIYVPIKTSVTGNSVIRAGKPSIISFKKSN